MISKLKLQIKGFNFKKTSTFPHVNFILFKCTQIN